MPPTTTTTTSTIETSTTTTSSTTTLTSSTTTTTQCEFAELPPKGDPFWNCGPKCTKAIIQLCLKNGSTQNIQIPQVDVL